MLRRGVAKGLRTRALFEAMGLFYASVKYEGVHPLELGALRRKLRTQRRYGLPRENLLIFYPRQTCLSLWRWGRLYLKLRAIHKRVLADPAS